MTGPACPGCGAPVGGPLHPLAATLLCEHCSTLSVVDGPRLRLPDTAEWDRLLALPHIARRYSNAAAAPRTPPPPMNPAAAPPVPTVQRRDRPVSGNTRRPLTQPLFSDNRQEGVAEC